MNLLTRLFRHLRTTAADARRAFPARTLVDIQKTIARGERMHRAEVRVIIESSLEFFDVLQRQTARMRARELFSEYRIWDTEENSGVLVYVNLADHKVEMICDRAVGRALPAQAWQTVCLTMTAAFKQGEYHDGIIAALDQLNAMLAEHFPCDGSSDNQLSNRPLML